MSLSDIIKNNIETLVSAEVIFNDLSDDQYTQVLTPFFTASVGKHFRHILDHYFCFLDGFEQGHINYDQRSRNTQIETQRLYTLQQTRELIEQLRQLDQRFSAKETCQMAHPLQASLASSVNDTELKPAHSSLARELIFLQGHTTHHYAIISIQLKIMECPVDANFGLAASTQIYNQQSSCAQ